MQNERLSCDFLPRIDSANPPPIPDPQPSERGPAGLAAKGPLHGPLDALAAALLAFRFPFASLCLPT
jgi:hypothetical protein